MMIRIFDWDFYFKEKSKLWISEHRNVLPVFIFVPMKVLVSLYPYENTDKNFFLLGTLQYMSPDVILVPPMGYGPEVYSYQNERE
jgi:hypothetical protein